MKFFYSLESPTIALVLPYCDMPVVFIMHLNSFCCWQIHKNSSINLMLPCHDNISSQTVCLPFWALSQVRFSEYFHPMSGAPACEWPCLIIKTYCMCRPDRASIIPTVTQCRHNTRDQATTTGAAPERSLGASSKSSAAFNVCFLPAQTDPSSSSKLMDLLILTKSQQLVALMLWRNLVFI